MKSEVTRNKDATVSITTSLPADDFAAFRPKALKHLGQHAKIDGFRKGTIPETIIEQRLGEGAILTQMAELALDHHYPALLKEHNIAAIGQPQITITKLAPGNPLEITITTAILPEIVLGDYLKTAKEIFGAPQNIEVTEADVEKTILEVRKQLYRAEHAHEEANTASTQDASEPNESDLPVIDDARAQKMGAKDFAHLKEELKKRMEIEEKLKEHDRRVNRLLDTLVETARITLPDILIDAELARMMAEMKANIEQIGITFDQYLIHIKKTEDELRTEHREAAAKRAASHLVLKHIAAEKKITVSEEELATEVARLAKLYPSTNTERIRAYVHDYMENQAVMVYLEKQAHESE